MLFLPRFLMRCENNRFLFNCSVDDDMLAYLYQIAKKLGILWLL
jgi:hypothetical protein